MKRRFSGWKQIWKLAVVVVCVGVQSRAQFSDPAAAPISSAFSIPQAYVIQPDALQKMLQAGATKPVVLQVGSRVMFDEAHIRGAQYAGPGSQADGLKLLEAKVSVLPKTAPIVIYCGCCPWNRCPNLGPAFHRLRALGFKNVKVLYLASNFGSDWVQKGYSVAMGG